MVNGQEKEYIIEPLDSQFKTRKIKAALPLSAFAKFSREELKTDERFICVRRIDKKEVSYYRELNRLLFPNKPTICKVYDDIGLFVDYYSIDIRVIGKGTLINLSVVTDNTYEVEFQIYFNNPWSRLELNKALQEIEKRFKQNKENDIEQCLEVYANGHKIVHDTCLINIITAEEIRAILSYHASTIDFISKLAEDNIEYVNIRNVVLNSRYYKPGEDLC